MVEAVGETMEVEREPERESEPTSMAVPVDVVVELILVPPASVLESLSIDQGVGPSVPASEADTATVEATSTTSLS